MYVAHPLCDLSILPNVRQRLNVLHILIVCPFMTLFMDGSNLRRIINALIVHLINENLMHVTLIGM